MALIPLDVQSVVEMNAELCADSGENSALLDYDGLDAALARPWSGFGDVELFPDLYMKAAALLHGIASRQVFENGNKRTAWSAAVAFLDVNGIDIGRVEPIHSDMYVRAASLDRSLEVASIADWFKVTHRAAAATGNVQRLAITRLGDVVARPDGNVDANGWKFGTLALEGEPDVEISPSGGVIGGWTAFELHTIAHGSECSCPVADLMRG